MLLISILRPTTTHLDIEGRTPISLTVEEEMELWADVCDVVCRLALGILDADPFSSQVARATANKVMDLLKQHRVIEIDWTGTG